MESNCNRVLTELLGSGWYWGIWGGYWVVLEKPGVLLDTAGYWGVLEGYWVLEVLGVLWGSTGYYEVPLGSVKYCWVFLGTGWY